MSTTTSKLGLIKPELSDSADITAMNRNWDRIDEMTAEDVGARPNTWMPTASDVGAIPWSMKGESIWADDLFRKYDRPTFVYWDANTLNSPLKFGLTWAAYGFAIVCGDTGYHTVIAWRAGGGNADMWMHTIEGGVDCGWYDMTDYFPLSGGTLRGDVIVETSSYPSTRLQNTTTGYHAILQCADDKTTVLINRKDSDNINYICLNDPSADLKKAIRLLNKVDGGSVVTYSLYGEHNKPSGSYNGNNSSTARYINTKGIGNMLVINGNGATTFVGAYGAFSIKSDGTTKTFPKNQLYFDIGNKNINMYTADANVNASGYRYDWAVL